MTVGPRRYVLLQSGHSNHCSRTLTGPDAHSGPGCAGRGLVSRGETLESLGSIREGRCRRPLGRDSALPSEGSDPNKKICTISAIINCELALRQQWPQQSDTVRNECLLSTTSFWSMRFKVILKLCLWDRNYRIPLIGHDLQDSGAPADRQ